MAADLRFLTFITSAVVGLVVLAAVTGPVGLGVSGRALALTVALAVYVVAAVVLLGWPSAGVPVTVVVLMVLAGAAAGMRLADPKGPVVGLFVVAAFAPLRLRSPLDVVVACAAVAVFDVALVSTASNGVVFALVTGGGAAFFFLFGWLLRRERVQRERVGRLLEELEAARAADRVSAALAERSRLAREMHDILAHTLSGLVLHLEGARMLVRTVPDTVVPGELAVTVERAHALARDGLAEARRAVGALRGDPLPGPEALPALVEEHRRAGGSAVLRVEGESRPLEAQARLAVYRTAQEALSNVRKHASDAVARVCLTWGDDGLVLVVENEGGVADAVPKGAGGYGLTGMAERAELLGGRLEAGPAGRGFRVRLVVPVERGER